MSQQCYTGTKITVTNGAGLAVFFMAVEPVKKLAFFGPLWVFKLAD